MSQEVEYQTERLDHLGILTGVCQEAGRAEWLDTQAGENRRSVSFGKAMVAMVFNGLGFSNRQLYLVPQYFENKPVEHVLGAGITADRRERSTVWGALWIGSTSMMSPFYLPDWRCKPVAASALPQTICISIRPRSREDGDYATKDEREPAALAITYGYSRDHREDLKQWDARPGQHS